MRWFQWSPRSERQPGREARNEQRKLTANLLNAIAILLVGAATAGPFVNPALADALKPLTQFFMFLMGGLVHLIARHWVRDIEDKA